MSNKKGGSLIALIMGIFVGGILGIILAPEKGKSTRGSVNKIFTKYRAILDKILEGTTQIGGDSKEKKAPSSPRSRTRSRTRSRKGSGSKKPTTSTKV